MLALFAAQCSRVWQSIKRKDSLICLRLVEGDKEAAACNQCGVLLAFIELICLRFVEGDKEAATAWSAISAVCCWDSTCIIRHSLPMSTGMASDGVLLLLMVCAQSVRHNPAVEVR